MQFIGNLFRQILNLLLTLSNFINWFVCVSQIKKLYIVKILNYLHFLCLKHKHQKYISFYLAIHLREHSYLASFSFIKSYMNSSHWLSSSVILTAKILYTSYALKSDHIHTRNQRKCCFGWSITCLTFLLIMIHIIVIIDDYRRRG